jgi:molybdopterin-containing oxidoreductase family iron-sulfur binding subunit
MKIDEHTTGSSYWRSLKEWANTEEYRELLKGEFPVGADLPPASSSRRRFLQLMGASIALAGATGCRWPKENIRPYANRPDGRKPGIPVHYATSMEVGGNAQALLVRSYDGRPIKVEGNDLHPINKGATDVIAQGTLLEMYDPDRSQHPRVKVAGGYEARNWNEFQGAAGELFTQIRAGGGAGFAILSEAQSSPSVRRLKARIAEELPQSTWVEYEPFSRDNEIAGTRIAFGRALRPHYRLDKAAVIADFDADILFSHPAFIKHARDFASTRDTNHDSVSRLYSIESGYSQTGVLADHRIAVASGNIHVYLVQLAGALVAGGLALEGALQAKVQEAAGRSEADPRVAVIAKDLLANKGRCVIAVGERHAPATHALAHALNLALGAQGATLTYTEEPDADRASHFEALQSLTARMQGGEVKTLLILGGNPVFTAPADVPFAEALGKVENSLHLSLYFDETSRLCAWHAPKAHYLESWGDSRSYDGTVCSVQPLIEPLYGGKSTAEVLSMVLGENSKGYDITRATLESAVGGADFEPAWRSFLDEGLRNGTEYAPVSAQANASEVANTISGLADALKTYSKDHLEIVLAPHPSIYDGRFANNGWLQEVPDFVTKLTWDNALILSPAAGRELGLETEDVARIEAAGRDLELPVYVLPGQSAYSATVHLGFGREAAGRVGDGVGVNTYVLRTTSAPAILEGVKISPTGRTYPLASTQDHYPIDPKGQNAIEARLDDLIAIENLHGHHGDEGHEGGEHHHDEGHGHGEHAHHPPIVSPWKEHEYDGFKWGMAIDLNKCIGCNACVVACQSENNIPVVGKEQVLNGREMHWIRIDRYFHGDPDHAEIAHQPMTCHHCENAPCEQVCPVAATVHDRDGLNVMVYNRCVGTRYCSNNCPYKVRRFNFFHYNYEIPEIQQMAYNPEVTMRSRGVMEKCTFCVQRISAVKIEARNHNRPIEDGEIQVACQQACPSRAIVFGDLNDEDSLVAKAHKDSRAYEVLEEMNVKARTRYITRVRNLNPEWVEA